MTEEIDKKCTDGVLDVSNDKMIKNYFEKVIEIGREGNQFPVRLEDVWPLAYSSKGNAVRDLKDKFIQDVDYQFFIKSANNSLVGRPSEEYMLSLSCMEFLVARKVRKVFEIYRQVLHAVTDGKVVLVAPKDYPSALRALADKVEENQRLEQQNLEQKKLIEAQKPKADFYDSVAGSKDAIPVGSVAKVLDFAGVGRNKLFQIMRDNGILMSNNQPYQKYIDCGYFRTIEQKWFDKNEEVNISIKTLAYQKGVDFIRKTLGSLGYVKRKKHEVISYVQE